MSRIFSFEREGESTPEPTLELMPLSVRRKLDLACLKLSLAGWQAMPVVDRRALVEAGAEVGDEASVAAFAAALRGAAGRAGAALVPLPPLASPAWRSPTVPAALGARLAELGASLDDAAWSSLDDDARYALVHLAGRDSDDHRARLRAALLELGQNPAPGPV